MALPASGQLSVGDIRTELVNTGTNSFSLAKAGQQYTAVYNSGYVPLNQSSTSKPDNSTSFNVSEWYSYNHSQNKACSASSFGGSTTTNGLNQYKYWRVNVTGCSGGTSVITVNYTNGAGNCFLPCSTYVYIYTSYPFTNTGTLTGSPVYTFSLSKCAGTGTYTYNYTTSSASDILYIVVYQDDSLGNGNCGTVNSITVTCSTATSYAFCLGYSATDCTSACTDYNGCLT